MQCPALSSFLCPRRGKAALYYTTGIDTSLGPAGMGLGASPNLPPSFNLLSWNLNSMLLVIPGDSRRLGLWFDPTTRLPFVARGHLGSIPWGPPRLFSDRPFL